MSKLWIYGAIPPEPAGGVSTFVERLTQSGNVPVAGVIDPYPGRKHVIPAEHVYPRHPGVMARLRVIVHLRKVRRYPLLVNVSRPRGVLALAPFLAGRRAPTFLILHHGNLQASGWLNRAALRMALSRYTRIGCLSETQRDFYLELGVAHSRLMLVDPYIAPVSKPVDPEASPLREVLAWLREGDGPLILSSGYAQDYYRHDWVLKAMESGNLPPDARYLICCYGPANPLLRELTGRASKLAQAYLAYGLDADQFHHMLLLADIYVRPTETDSFGIAVWDAAAAGLTIVASDACRRPPDALVHPVDNFGQFLECIQSALADRPDQITLRMHSEQRYNIEALIIPFIPKGSAS